MGLDKPRLTPKQHRWRASPLATASPNSSSDFSLVEDRNPRAPSPNLRQPNSPRLDPHRPCQAAPSRKQAGVNCSANLAPCSRFWVASCGGVSLTRAGQLPPWPPDRLLRAAGGERGGLIAASCWEGLPGPLRGRLRGVGAATPGVRRAGPGGGWCSCGLLIRWHWRWATGGERCP